MLTFKKTITKQKKEKQELLFFMDKFQLKPQFEESATKVVSIIYGQMPLGMTTNLMYQKHIGQIFTN